jgi:gluconolactonase
MNAAKRFLFALPAIASLVLAEPAGGKVVKLAPELDRVVPSGAQVEKVASGFGFVEGPVWIRNGGYLLFSDIPGNVIMKWQPKSGVSVFRKSSGYGGADAQPGAFIGSNGLTVDKQGRLTICEHGNRRVTRIEPNGQVTVLADRYEGKRLNSPNDLTYKSNGDLYFTDPPHGLPKEDQDPAKELSFNGVYRVSGGKLQLLTKQLKRPNGIAFSPDEKYLYVGNSDASRRIWMRFVVKPDGSLGEGEVFYDATRAPQEGVPDGLKVDGAGDIFSSGPGGLWIFSSNAKHIGTIELPELPANCAWGDNGKALYMTARTSLYRVRLNIEGIRP